MHKLRRAMAAFAVGVSLLLQQGIVTAQTETSKTQDPLGQFISTLEIKNEGDGQAGKPARNDESDKSRYEGLVDKVAKRFGRSRKSIEQILQHAEKYAQPGFPKLEDILAIISVESSFNPNAFSQGNVGLMQINLAANGRKLANRSVEENIRVGAFILDQYYGMAGRTPRGAVLAYNAGIGNFYKKRYSSIYYTKYMRERAWIVANL